MSKADRYVPTAREQAFLDTVESPRYDRQTVNGLRPFFDARVADDMLDWTEQNCRNCQRSWALRDLLRA